MNKSKEDILKAAIEKVKETNNLEIDVNETFNKLMKEEKEFLKLSISKEEQQLNLKSSKIGGYGYLPQEFEYPLDLEQRPMILLAQLNFSELPKLTGYPTEGILAFYIAGDDMYGLGYDDYLTDEGKRVLYFKDPSQESKSSVDIANIMEPLFEDKDEVYLPFKLGSEYKLEASISTEMPISNGSEETNDLFKDLKINASDLIDKLDDDQVASLENSGSKIGGYPFFTQEDTRYTVDNPLDYKLLFQLDTYVNGDKDIEITWGDSGVGNFFLKDSDLEKLNFNEVFYSWDCY